MKSMIFSEFQACTFICKGFSDLISNILLYRLSHSLPATQSKLRKKLKELWMHELWLTIFIANWPLMIDAKFAKYYNKETFSVTSCINTLKHNNKIKSMIRAFRVHKISQTVSISIDFSVKLCIFSKTHCEIAHFPHELGWFLCMCN